MAKKMKEDCGCTGGMHVKMVLMSVVVLVLGVMLIWPQGWFTFEHTLGLMVVLFGLKKLGHALTGHHCC